MSVPQEAIPFMNLAIMIQHFLLLTLTDGLITIEQQGHMSVRQVWSSQRDSSAVFADGDEHGSSSRVMRYASYACQA